MKKTQLLVAFVLLTLKGFTQFPLHAFFPSGVNRSLFFDSLLMQRAILEREGIRTITIHQHREQQGTSSYQRIEYDLTHGRIDAQRWFVERKKYNDTLYMHMDSLLYDNQGRLSAYWTGRSGRTFVFQEGTIEYPAAGKVTSTGIVTDHQRSLSDTSIYYGTYNGQHQLVRLDYTSKGPYADKAKAYNPAASVYYNPDGWPDSIRHDNPYWGTYIFKRSKKGKQTYLTMETTWTSHQWVYNAAGQCITSGWTSKSGRSEKHFSKAKYYYNKEGTVAKVVETSSGINATSRFVYSKD